MPDNRREFLQKMLAIVPASIIGRGMLKSANVPKALDKCDTPRVVSERVSGRLPDGWHLYESCGQCLFPLYGMSGGVSTSCMAYLVREQIANRADMVGRYDYEHEWLRGGPISGTMRCWEVIPLEFTDLEFVATNYEEAAMIRLINAKIYYAMKLRKPTLVNPDGGNMPRVPYVERQAEQKWFEKHRTKFNDIIADHLRGVYPVVYGAPISVTAKIIG